jgi:nitroreductase
VAALDPNRLLVLRSSIDLRGRPFDADHTPPAHYLDSTWSFLLSELPGGRTRLVVSGYTRGRPRALLAVVNTLLGEPAHWVMQRRQIPQPGVPGGGRPAHGEPTGRSAGDFRPCRPGVPEAHAMAMNTSASRTGAVARGDTLSRAVEHALRAPSVHNTQPWRWRIGDDVVELHADRARHLTATDPDRRDLLISCGAALHHLRVALAGLGLATTTERLPDPDRADLLARVRVANGPVDDQDAALARAIDQRRTDRRAFTGDAEPAQLRRLAAHAARLGAALISVSGPTARARLAAVLGDAADRQRYVPGYPAELAIWTRRYAGGRDGVPPELRTNQAPAHGLRRFPSGELGAAPAPRTAAEDLGTLTVLTTDGDELVDRLRAGEATSAVLLAATREGLATTPLSQALEIVQTRRALAHATGGRHPQLVIRVGLPPAGRPIPASERRPLSWTLQPDDRTTQ